MLPEDDLSLPLLVRNMFAVENRYPQNRLSHKQHMKLSTLIARAFEEQCAAHLFMGYVVPYNGSAPVEPKTFKFNARWTFEAAQDAKAATGIDIEKELTDALVGEMFAEIAVFARDQIILPCIVETSGIVVDPNTFEPCARFRMLYYSSPSRMTPPIDLANAPPVFA